MLCTNEVIVVVAVAVAVALAVTDDTSSIEGMEYAECVVAHWKL